MFIVLEGLDRTGKTTLANRLGEMTGATVRHFSKPGEHPLDEYLKPLDERQPDLICDRYHLGERVWPDYFGRKSEFDRAMKIYIDLAIASRGGVVLKTERDLDEIKQALEGEPVKPEDVERLDQEFIKLLEETGRIVPAFALTYNSSRIQYVLTLAKVREERARAVADITPRYVGSAFPRILLVGDQVGNFDYTFPFVPHKMTSGNFMLHELADDEEVLSRLGIVNSLDPYDELEPVAELVEHFKNPRVVALGDQASSRLKEQGISHTRVYHPQYVRRFERKKGDGYYRRLIREAGGL